jgi:predicted transcriptional regulator
MENYKQNKKFINSENNIYSKNNEIQDKQENLVKDLKQTLQTALEETLEDLDKLLKAIKNTTEEKSTYEDTKELVQQINNNITDTIKNHINRIPEKMEQNSKSIFLNQEEE